MQKFTNIFNEYNEEIIEIDELILASSLGKSSLITEITKNLISSGGKRIRPILLLIAAKLCQPNSEASLDKNADSALHLKSLYLASAVEMIHSATLLHDDVVDASEIRRGKKTANAIWDNKASILVGDYLFSLAFQFMVKSDNLKILELLAKTSSIIADGEVLQLQNSTNIDLSLENYFKIIFGKTAVLFSACCEVGALVNNRDSQETEALRNFGKNLGMIFQITDDILDYSSTQETLGKEIGNDFFEGKVTLPIIKTYQDCDLNDKKLIKEMFEKNFLNAKKNPEDFTKILNLINKYNGIKKSQEIALDLAQKARNDLQNFEDNIYKNHLLSILEYSHYRIF